MTTGIVEPTLPQLRHQLRNQGEVFPRIIPDPYQIRILLDRLVGNGSGCLKFAKIFHLHLRFAKHPGHRDHAVFVLVDTHDCERNKLTRHCDFQFCVAAADD